MAGKIRINKEQFEKDKMKNLRLSKRLEINGSEKRSYLNGSALRLSRLRKKLSIAALRLIF